MNVLFTVVFAASAAALLFRDAAAFLPALLAGAGKAVALGLQLAAVWAVWLGFLHVAEDAGILRGLSRAVRPIIPHFPPFHNSDSERIPAGIRAFSAQGVQTGTALRKTRRAEAAVRRIYISAGRSPRAARA